MQSSVFTLLLAGTAFVGAPGLAHAADQGPVQAASDAATGSDTPQENDLVVTGSRIVRDGYTAPTPVTVASAQDLLQGTPSSIPDGLNKLPQFTNSQSPSRSALNFANAPIHGNVLNLRGVGPLRTLILFDGVRMAPTTYVGTVDTNVIPNLLIERVEVVTGGASAAYGSDAVSGVVNFVLNKKFTGLTGVAQAGVSQRGDNGNQRIGAAGGFNFADGRGHILLSAEYFNSEGMLRNDRALGRTGATYVGSVVGSTATPGSAANPYISRDNVKIPTASDYSKINSSNVAGNPFVNYVFDRNGGFRPFQPGAPTGSSFQIGGDGFAIPTDISSIAPLTTYQSYGRIQYDVTSDISAYVSGGFSRSDLEYTSLSNNFNVPNTVNIYKGNPFLPAVMDATLATENDFFTIGNNNGDGLKPLTRERTDYWMVTAGLDGKFGDDLSWNIAYSHGDSKANTAQSGLYNWKNAIAALDAVRGPGNTITCRVLLNPDPAIRAQYAGCQPLNILGGEPSQATPAGYAYATGTSRFQAKTKQDTFVANLSGSLFDLPAGSVDFAVGAEYRRQTLDLTSNANPALLAGPTAADTAAIRSAYFAGLRGVPATALFYQLTNVGIASGTQKVKEAYVEVAVPVLKDTPFFQELSVNGAGRITDYSTSGTVKTWKLGLTWKPVDDMMLRGNLSRDIRAPNLFELFAGDASAVTLINDPASGTQSSINLVNGGNPQLVPEIAKTLTIGGVFSPSFLSGFSASIDYYRLKINKQIGSLTAQQIVNNCAAAPGGPECDLITRPSPTAFPTSIRVAPANIAFLKTSGIDFDATYRGQIGSGALSLRLFASHLINYDSQQSVTSRVLSFDGISVVSGTPSAFPKWRGSFNIDYQVKAFGINISQQYIGKVTVGLPGPTPTFFLNNEISPEWYTDLTLRADVPTFGGNAQFFFTVNNLFDNDPPLIPSTTPANNFPTNLALYDTVGRAFTAGVRWKF